ncbi:MAG: hypothetical protein HY319_04440 [Armatimonadetes bacterium]|nr:hypothetical protein [Armatimonadota bacterium]
MLELEPGLALTPGQRPEVRAQFTTSERAPDIFNSMTLHERYARASVPILRDGRFVHVPVAPALDKIQDPEVLRELEELDRQPFADGLDGRRITAETIVEVADPRRTISQDAACSCSATSLEEHLAENDPEEFVDTVAALSSPAGKHGFLQRTGVCDDGTGRTTVDRLVQDAYMAVGGERSLEMAVMADVVCGENFDVVLVDDSDRSAVLDAVRSSAGSAPIVLGVDWHGEGHMVMAKGMEADQVVFFNPRGFQPQTLARLGPDHQVRPDGLESSAELARRVEFALVPERLVQGIDEDHLIPVRLEELLKASA